MGPFSQNHFIALLPRTHQWINLCHGRLWECLLMHRWVAVLAHRTIVLARKNKTLFLSMKTRLRFAIVVVPFNRFKNAALEVGYSTRGCRRGVR